MTYNSYKDVRGAAAEPFSVAMGIEEESGIAHTGHLVEIRTAEDHLRISAHATTYAKEVLIFNDHSLEVIELDTVAKKAIKTVYDPKDGSITKLQAAWSAEANGYESDYEEVEKLTKQDDIIAAEWEKYDTILMNAELQAS